MVTFSRYRSNFCLRLFITSDSDVAGLEIDAVETLQDSGMFVASITFSQDQSSAGNRLFAIPGDSIYAKYDDHTLPNPYSIVDNIEIKTTAKLDSFIPSVERIQNSEIKLVDSFGNELESLSTEYSMQIVGTVSNLQNFEQDFVYLIQVKDANDFVVSISWIKAQISSLQSLDVSQSWLPSKSGNYLIETSVWKSLSDPTALSPLMTTTVFVE